MGRTGRPAVSPAFLPGGGARLGSSVPPTPQHTESSGGGCVWGMRRAARGGWLSLRVFLVPRTCRPAGSPQQPQKQTRPPMLQWLQFKKQNHPLPTENPKTSLLGAGYFFGEINKAPNTRPQPQGAWPWTPAPSCRRLGCSGRKLRQSPPSPRGLQVLSRVGHEERDASPDGTGAVHVPLSLHWGRL